MTNFRFGNYRYSRGRANYGTVLAFLAIGLGLGALAALLVAPKTGKQIRKNVRRRYEDARDAMGDWRDRAGDAMGDWRERAGDAWERRDEWADAARRKVEPVARPFRKG